MRYAILLAAVMLVAPSVAHAQRYDVRPTFTKCMDLASGYDGRILECIDMEATYQDELLNRVYRRTMARLRPAQRIVLRNSQRRWLRERFDMCMRENGDPSGGTMERWLNNHCNLYETIARTEWLNNYRP